MFPEIVAVMNVFSPLPFNSTPVPVKLISELPLAVKLPLFIQLPATSKFSSQRTVAPLLIVTLLKLSPPASSRFWVPLPAKIIVPELFVKLAPLMSTLFFKVVVDEEAVTVPVEVKLPSTKNPGILQT